MAWDDVLVAHVSKYTAAIHNEMVNQIKARILHSLDTEANGVLVGTGAGSFIFKTLAQFKVILGLGDAAYKNTGTTTGTVCAGDDSRLSNPRDPNAHKSTHATGQSDALSASDIGAEPANANIQSHISSTSNPHGVTAAQTGALPISGGTITGDLTCNGTITGVKPDLNSVTSNLGNPTVEEMALCHGQFSNKLRFIPADLQEESIDGINWTTSTRVPADQLAEWMIGEGQAYDINIIPSMPVEGYGFYRLTWMAANNGFHVYLNSLYLYIGSSGNTLNIKIEGCLGNTKAWTTIVTGNICNWGGHVYLPHDYINLFISSNDWACDGVRITFSVASATTTGPIWLSSIEWFGGYPAGRRNVESYDKDKNVTFPAGITAGGVISPQRTATASAPTYAKGAIYFDTTLNKLMIGGATGWETVNSS